jgi:osmotically-inducible protein OsmY
MTYSDRPGDRDRDRERDWIRDERLRARDAYDHGYGEEGRRLERSYAYRSDGRDHDREREMRRGRERDYGTRGYVPYGTTGPTYYGGGYSGEVSHYPGDVGREYADEEAYRYGAHEMPSGHYFGDTSRHRGRADYVPNPREGRGEEGRSWLNRAADEVQAFFGDDDARRRREWDEMRRGSEQYASGEHRGRGPRGYRRSDERIREDVSDRLTDDAWLDATYIEVQSKDGEVTLSGLVSNRGDKRRAEDLADRCSGVTHVQNNLRVQTAERTYGDAERRDTLATGGAAATQANTTTTGRA